MWLREDPPPLRGRLNLVVYSSIFKKIFTCLSRCVARCAEFLYNNVLLLGLPTRTPFSRTIDRLTEQNPKTADWKVSISQTKEKFSMVQKECVTVVA